MRSKVCSNKTASFQKSNLIAFFYFVKKSRQQLQFRPQPQFHGLRVRWRTLIDQQMRAAMIQNQAFRTTRSFHRPVLEAGTRLLTPGYLIIFFFVRILMGCLLVPLFILSLFLFPIYLFSLDIDLKNLIFHPVYRSNDRNLPQAQHMRRVLHLHP